MADTYGLELDSSCKLKIIRDGVGSFVRKASEGGMRRKSKKSAQETKPNTQSRLLALIARIPRGKVSTYGAIARAAGILNGARQTARALRGAHGVPWQRVLGAGGTIKLQGEHAFEQRFRLQSEGVAFRGKRVDMKLHEHKFKAPRKK